MKKTNIPIDNVETGKSRDFATNLAPYPAFSIHRDNQALERPSNNWFLKYNYNTLIFWYNLIFDYYFLPLTLL